MGSGDHSSVVLVQEFWEQVFNLGNYAFVPEMIGPAYTYNGQPQTAADVQGFAQELRANLEGLHFNIDDIFGDGKNVALRWTLTGTDVKTRKPFEASAINMIRIIDGQALSNWQGGG